MIDPDLFESLPLITDGDLTCGDLTSGDPPAEPKPYAGEAQGSMASKRDATLRRMPLPEQSVLSHPDRVQTLHREFVGSGACVLRTLTARASPEVLRQHGLTDRAEAIHVSGHALARGALTGPGAIMAPLRPPIHLGEPAADIPWETLYGDRIVYLSDAGVDFFVLEHVDRVEDALALISLVKHLTDAPVLGLLHGAESPNHSTHEDLAETAARLAAAGADALGLSCIPVGSPVSDLLETLAAPGLPLAALLRPFSPDGRFLDPASFAAGAAPLADRETGGAVILGGCCGVTPAHIAALFKATHPDADQL